MKLKKIKIEDILNFDNYATFVSLFEKLSDDSLYPLVKDFINSDNYDDISGDYFFNHSNEKYLSPFASKIYFYQVENQQEDSITAFNIVNNTLASILYRRFGDKWNRLYTALTTEYDPLENYDMEQVETPDITRESTENVSSDITTSISDSRSDSSVYGFNSSSPSPSVSVENSSTTNVTGDGKKNERHVEDTETGTRKLTKHGNIGVTTSQQMLEAELEVRKNEFYKILYNDIDSILCLKTY